MQLIIMTIMKVSNPMLIDDPTQWFDVYVKYRWCGRKEATGNFEVKRKTLWGKETAILAAITTHPCGPISQTASHVRKHIYHKAVIQLF